MPDNMYLILLFIVVVYFMYQINILKCEKFDSVTPSNPDMAAINTLSQVANGLMTGGFTVPGNLNISGNLNTTGTLSTTGDITTKGFLKSSGIELLSTTSGVNECTINGLPIFTNKVQVQKDLNVGSNTTIGGTLNTTGNTTIGGTLNTTGNTTIGGTLNTTGNTTIGGTLNVDYIKSLTPNSVSGTMTYDSSGNMVWVVPTTSSTTTSSTTFYTFDQTNITFKYPGLYIIQLFIAIQFCSGVNTLSSGGNNSRSINLISGPVSCIIPSTNNVATSAGNPPPSINFNTDNSSFSINFQSNNVYIAYGVCYNISFIAVVTDTTKKYNLNLGLITDPKPTTTTTPTYSSTFSIYKL